MKAKLFLFILLLSNTLFAQNSFLSVEQIDYLKKKKVIKMCNNPNWEPIEFAKNNDLNNMQGIAIDTLNIIEKKLGITFENVPTKSWKESQEFLKNKKCDILPCAVKTTKRSEYANFTKPYLNLPLAIFTQKDKPIVSGLDEVMDKTWTRQQGSGLITKLRKVYPDLKVIEVKGDKEALQWVNSGKAYFTIATLPVASHYISKFSLNDLHIAGYSKMLYDLSIAVRNDDTILLSTLNDTLAQITPEQNKTIFKKWVSPSIKEPIVDYTLFWQLLVVVVIVIALLIYREREVDKMNKFLKLTVKRKTRKLEALNESLEEKVETSVANIRERDKLLTQQAKMASMGEMLENIAHQWRQPLSAITATSTGMKVQSEMGLLSDEDNKKAYDNITNAANLLSQTIDNFRDFFKVEKDTTIYDINDLYKKTLFLVDSQFKHNNIKLIENTSTVKIKILGNEIIQVILNLLNNAKDALLENKVENKLIFVDIFTQEKSLFINIKDTAGGIPEDIIDRIFEPYFTTKEKHGTGIGLYMSKKIIENHLNGKLCVINREFEHKGETYKGAKFIIQLPLNEEINTNIN